MSRSLVRGRSWWVPVGHGEFAAWWQFVLWMNWLGPKSEQGFYASFLMARDRTILQNLASIVAVSSILIQRKTIVPR